MLRTVKIIPKTAFCVREILNPNRGKIKRFAVKLIAYPTDVFVIASNMDCRCVCMV